MSKTLKISDELFLPLELAARTQCIFAQKGAGKTYCAGVQTEEMLGAGVQMCILDPTGVWWGLQSSSDGGKSPYEIIVMGGSHADVPLEPDAGEIVASFLVESGQSVVLDVSQFESQAAQDRFALALATKLYRLKAHDRANIHIMLDEADQFCPLRPQKGQERLLHAWSLIVRLGRSRGLGLTAISNRPAAVHTDIRNNIDLLTCMRVTGPHDFKALREWTGIHATQDQAKEFLETVPALPNGEAFFWSPSWLGIFKRAKVREKHTFDSSRTPKPGERAIEPKARRAPDLTKLTEQIKASVQRAKESDPKALRAELARVKAELAKAQKPAPAAAAKVEQKRVEIPVLKDGQLDRAEKLISRLADLYAKAGEFGQGLKASADGIAAAIKRTTQPIPAVAAARVAPVVAAPVRPRIQQPSPAQVHRTLPDANRNGEVGKGGLRRILISLAQRPNGLTTSQIGLRAKLSSNSGTFDTYMSRARKSGWIVENNGKIFITDVGLSAIGEYQLPNTGQALLNDWLKELGNSGANRILNALASAWPNALTNDQIGEAAGLSPASGTFDTYMSRLRGLELMESPSKGLSKASDELFD